MARQREDARSMLALHKALIALRRAEPALQLGRLELVETAGDILAYVREDRFLIILNLGNNPRGMALPRAGAIVLSTHLDRAGERVDGALELRPNEGLIVRFSNGH